MANLQKVIKVTQAQYNTLASGGTVGSYTGLNDNYVYLIEDTNEYITSNGGVIDGGELFLDNQCIHMTDNIGIYVTNNDDYITVAFNSDQYGNEIIYNDSSFYKPLFVSDYCNIIFSEDSDYYSNTTFNTLNFKILDDLNTHNYININPSDGAIYYYDSGDEVEYEYDFPHAGGTLALESYVEANPQTTTATLSGIKIGNISYSIQGGVTDVQINGTSILSNTVANIITNTAYNASSNKIATMSDVPHVYNFLESSESGA